jgi:hypothetical protein
MSGLPAPHHIGRDYLVYICEDVLQALAHSALAPAEQKRLDDLLPLNADGQLSETDQAAFDHLLHYVDQLSTLKTRARYTLAHQTRTLLRRWDNAPHFPHLASFPSYYHDAQDTPTASRLTRELAMDLQKVLHDL